MTTIGEHIGPYLLGECLGTGGFGAVYEATHRETGQRVAVKFLHDIKEMDPDVQNRFVREVTLLQKLAHENIVQVFDSGLHEGRIYCAMELVECGALDEVLLARQQLPWREAAEVALQVCWALDHAHQRGCVHRDLKPANIFLAEDGLMKLGDLGLARDLNNSRLTAEGQTVGTWRYMPPEQITGEAHIDGRLDLYALGCILFEMVAGRVPFEGSDFAQIFDQHLEAAPARLDVLVADCPQTLATLVDQMLEKRPQDRPENAAVVAEQLEQILAGKLTSDERADATKIDDHSTAQPNLTHRLQSQNLQKADAGRQMLAVLAATIALVIAILIAIKSGK